MQDPRTEGYERINFGRDRLRLRDDAGAAGHEATDQSGFTAAL